MRIIDRIGDPFPADGCTGYATRIASEFHGVPIRDPMVDPEFLEALARGDDTRCVCGCIRVTAPLHVGDILVYGAKGWQHMGIVGEGNRVLHVHAAGLSRLTDLKRIMPFLISAWRPLKVANG